MGACLAALALSATAFCGPRVLSEVKFLFAGPGKNGYAPVLTLKNPGRDLAGTIVLTSPSAKTVIPFSLASGAQQQFELPDRDDFIGTASLETNEGSIPIERVPNDYYGWRPGSFVAVGDDKGAFKFLDSGSEKVGTVLDAEPSLMPTNVSAYKRIRTVVLAHGAVRMSDTSVDILKQVILSGRTLVLIGGAGAPWWQDRRWADLIPAETDGSTEQVEGAKVVEGAKGQASLLRLKALPDATPIEENGLTVGVSRAFGAGRVYVIAYDPTATPFASELGRGDAFASLLSSDVGTGTAAEPPQPTRRRRRITVSSPSPFSSQNDPFSIELPRAGDVVVILIIYCVLVAPVNLMLLRKIGRPEWAWFTVPVLAAGAAGLILLKSRSLYETANANAVRATVVFAQGQDRGVATGSTDVFFPNAGSHRLPIQDLLSVEGNANTNPFGSVDPLTVVDDGRNRQALINTSNLEFRTINFAQSVEASRFIKVVRTGPNQIEVTNLTTSPMDKVSVNDQPSVPLASGQTKSFTINPKPDPKEESIESPEMGAGFRIGRLSKTRPDADIVHASLSDAPVGVTLGTRRKVPESIRLTYVLPRREVNP